ncbi:hypothetical protein SAMN05518672_1164 [Chitinophaga sp. CF118]|uniref:hypothetical protein n=1 Tax=Chitinophaga sp. CF118 TaxID=1884367 RepID=UPI0008F2B7D5|nr:hypothetical protein [Chitinophaga sp. CF118]SFF09313.1 hypothetical protein SAMN05518672_1164 [Chitinophaga sp. CF118]
MYLNLNNILIIPLSLLFIGCSTNTRKLSPQEITCQDETKKAQADIKNGKIVYCNYTNPKFQPLRYIDEMSELLLKQHIVIQDFRNYNQSSKCYCESMEDEIKRHFGGDFITSVKRMSDSIFLVKHINDTIEPEDCDTRPAYPGSTKNFDESDLFQSRFDSLVKYPKGYKNRIETASRDLMYVKFVVKKTGEIVITGFISVIRNTNNKQFKKYLENQIRNTLPLNGWKSATILGQPVNCNMGISIELK